MRLKFTLDEARQTFVCKFRLSKRYTGPPGHCHGGIIATILDDAMGKVNKLRHVIALTKEMTVEYLKPVPLHKPLHVEGREVSVRAASTSTPLKFETKKTKSWRAAKEPSSPSTPKKCSPNSWSAERSRQLSALGFQRGHHRMSGVLKKQEIWAAKH